MKRGHRRVYVLPAEMIAGVRAFQTRIGLANETEAIRRLISAGLAMNETPDEVQQRIEAMIARGVRLREAARDVLAMHPLVRRVGFYSGDDGGEFETKDGTIRQFGKRPKAGAA